MSNEDKLYEGPIESLLMCQEQLQRRINDLNKIAMIMLECADELETITVVGHRENVRLSQIIKKLRNE